MNEIGRKIREARKAKGWSQATLGARAGGYSQQAIYKMEKVGVKEPRDLGAIEKALGMAEGELKSLVPNTEPKPRGNIPLVVRQRVRQLNSSKLGGHVYYDASGAPQIPVMGRAAAGDTTRIIMSNEPIVLLPCPPELIAIPGAYCLYVQGESMIPRFRPSERIFVHPVQPYAKGDYCVIQIGDPEEAPEAGYIKRFERWDSEELVVSQLNPESEMRFPQGRVQAIHLIVGTWRH